MRSEPTRAALFCLIGLILAAVMILSSCSVQRLERIHTLEANNLLEQYYETQWNKENNQPGEVRAARQEIRAYLHEQK